LGHPATVQGTETIAPPVTPWECNFRCSFSVVDRVKVRLHNSHWMIDGL
jgi:hypothetical protein